MIKRGNMELLKSLVKKPLSAFPLKCLVTNNLRSDVLLTREPDAPKKG